uniref:Minor capsid protein n=1 Tax=Dulem virus 33 TaxID=3145751 RepID=A0AAU8B5W5_9CAUD
MAKPDEGHRLTDKELDALEKRIASVYKQARDDIQDQVTAYFQSFAKRDEEMKELIGTIVNGKEWTEQDYKQWRLAQIGRGERFEALRDKLAERMTKANQTAISYVNDATPGIYSLNRNYAAYTIEQVAGDVGFTLWDEQTVKRIIVEQPDLMPYYPEKKAVKRGIDLAYGKQQITSTVASGILQGKSIKGLADDLQNRIPAMNRDSAVRTARTAVTGAQNAGRQDSYEAAVKMGIEMEKQWLATLDNRTRHEHAMLDGQTVDYDEPFEIYGYKLMYPGDPSGAPEMVYNCRCTMIARVKGVPAAATRRSSDGIIPNMTYQEWVESK